MVDNPLTKAIANLVLEIKDMVNRESVIKDMDFQVTTKRMDYQKAVPMEQD